MNRAKQERLARLVVWLVVIATVIGIAWGIWLDAQSAALVAR